MQQTFPSLLKASNVKTLLSLLKNPNHFAQILSRAITTGQFFTDPFVSSSLLHHALFNSNSTLAFARILFSQIPNPNIYSWNFMIRALSQSSTPLEAINYYSQMRREGDVIPDKHTFPFVIRACGRSFAFDKGRELHCLSIKFGLEFDVFVQNALISMSCQCRAFEFARKVFDFMPAWVRDVVSWNSLVSGYVQGELYGEALKLIKCMSRVRDMRLNDVTLVTALTACARTRLLELGRQIHDWITVNGLVLDVFFGSSLIDMYTKCGRLKEARVVFDRLSVKNVVCWTSMIAGYVQSDMFKEATELFREMQMDGVRPEPATIASVLSACGHLGALDQGRWVHRYCEKHRIGLNLIVKNALIDMYSKCGDVEKALEVFNRLTNTDIYSWSTIISGLAMNGKSGEALQLFSQMETSSGIRPNEVTFLGVLSACCHGGLVDAGLYHFETMTIKYNLVPQLEHYGCIIDLLARTNLLAEAKRFIKAMPVEPDAVIWRSLLFACRNNGNLELAEFAANKIEELEPETCGSRVLLSNIYASTSRWSDVKRIRRTMAVQGIQKQPGCSFIELNGIVHEFFVADNLHHQADIVHEMIIAVDRVLRIRSNLDFLDFDLLCEAISYSDQDIFPYYKNG